MNIIETGTSWVIKDKLNSDLVNEFKEFLNNNLDFLYKDKKGYSTTGKNAEQYWIKFGRDGDKFSYKNSQYDVIEKKLTKEIYERLKSTTLLRDETRSVAIEIESGSTWTVVGEEGSYHTIHNHISDDGIFLSGISVVLYLSVPKKVEGYDNDIYLVLHTDLPNPYTREPISNVYHCEVEVGTLLIFPNHILHGTYPQTKGTRQTFNIEYKFTTKPKPIKILSGLNYT